MTIRQLILVSSMLIPAIVIAGTERQHGSHEHGVARLDVAIDDGKLQLHLISPADNLLGFEHAPRNPEQQRVLTEALNTLRQAITLFVVNQEAGCALEENEIESPFDEHDDHDHGHDDHAHEEHGHHDHGHDHDSHADIHAEWVLECRDTRSIDSLEIGLFEAFPRMQRIKVQLITEDRQDATMLTPARYRIDL